MHRPDFCVLVAFCKDLPESVTLHRAQFCILVGTTDAVVVGIPLSDIMPAPLAKGKVSFTLRQQRVSILMGCGFSTKFTLLLCLMLRRSSGLIFSMSLLFAAGLAVYNENPQIKEWIDARRRDMAIAMQSLSEEVSPSSSRRTPPFDASTQEDSSPEAEDRRRAARQQILERGMLMQARRRGRQESTGTAATSFDHLVDSEGRLRQDGASSSAAVTETENTALRRRNTEHRAAILGAAFANPFDDEVPLDQYPPNLRPDMVEQQHSDDSDLYNVSRSSTPVPPSSPNVATPSIVQPYAPSDRLIDVDEYSNHPSEEMLGLTPTTSVASLHDMGRSTPDPHAPSTHSHSQLNQVNLEMNEWAHRSTSSFYSMPDSPNVQPSPNIEDERDMMEREMEEMIRSSEADSESEAEHVSRFGSEADPDVMSDISVMTPSTWTEVGSVVSEAF